MGKRESDRVRAQLRRRIAKSLAEQKVQSRRSRVATILGELRVIVLDSEFAALAIALGVETVPQRLTIDHQLMAPNDDQAFAVSTMDYLVAWKFMHPFMESCEMKEYLYRRWPNFTLEFREVFISLVMDGPFPNERRTAMRATFFR